MHLTPKEKRAIWLLLEGMSYREIGALLGSTEQVIKNLMKVCFNKCGAGGKTELALMALHNPQWLDAAACQGCGRIRRDSMPDEERSEAIRLREEEIKQVRYSMETATKTANVVELGKSIWHLRAQIWQRILHREEAALADLKRGGTA